MIPSFPRLLLLAATTSTLLVASPTFSQTVVSSPPTSDQILPDAPAPQITVAALDVESIFSSSNTASQQPQTAPADSTQKPMTDAEKKQAAEDEARRELHQRMGGVVPNFNAVLDGSNTHLTPGQKMRAAFKSATDPYQFGLAALTSGFGQAENSHTTYNPVPGTNPTIYTQAGYGQGWAGYGKRMGASYTDQFDGTILGNGVFPILLHQDSRYYRMATGSFKKRFLYAIGTAVYCKGDNGKWQPNYSNLLGNIAAGGISNLYYPAADRGFGLTIEQGFLVTAEGSFGALLIEFYPDISRHFHHLPKSSTTQP